MDDEPDWDAFLDDLATLKEWAEAEDREDVLAALETLIAAVKEKHGEGVEEGEGEQ